MIVLVFFIAIKGCTEDDIDVDVDGISVQVPITYLGANKNEIDIQVSRHISESMRIGR